jgi:hypothetical protein
MKFETARKIERVERMVRDLQATLEKKDTEQKMERMQAQAQATLEKKDTEQKMERMQVAFEKKDLEQKMERMQAQATLEKKGLEQKMERMQAQAQSTLEKKDLEQKMERMQLDTSMRAVLENEKRDRQLENEKQDREADTVKRDQHFALENEKRDREADKKEAQHQIDQLKWEARFSKMEQQQRVYSHNTQQLGASHVQYAAGAKLGALQQPKAALAPQGESKLQRIQRQAVRPQEEEMGPSHSVTPVNALQPVLPDSTAISPAAPQSAELSSLVAARSQVASVSQCPLVQLQQPQHQHQVTAGPLVQAGPVPLPGKARTHFFLSHCQATGGDQTNAIYLELRQLGFSCWYDNRATDLTKDGMKHGIEGAAAFLLFLSESVLNRSFCQFEIREAIALKKPMVLVHESDPRFGAFDFQAARKKAPPDLQDMLDNHESLPFRRRGYERDGMLQTLIEHAGFKALLDAAQVLTSATELAKVPTEIQHFDLESFHDRPVQTALIELLLLPKQDKRFTSCVVMHGMGGTGKTVTAVAVVQEKTLRGYFSHIYWLTVGADAVGERIRQLQSALHTQLTGKAMASAEVQQKDEKEWLGMLVEAMPMDRSLVVLDDPWLPEQVRFLNPVDSVQTEHRLLVTTRIRGLAHSRATCIELSMMAKDEAVALLLDVAGIKKREYQIENPGSQWPPPAAYGLASECGLLPITLTITAQLVRSWGKGWEKAVLPLLQEGHGSKEGRNATTVEARIIGAGLKSLKGEDAAAIKALFEMFAVTQEDFVHPMAIIELLWRLCCTSSTEAAGGLSARLKVRQWTQVLIDQSLLLGSSSKGIHVHDIVLTNLQSTRSALELRALHKRVVEGLVAASTERTAATGRGFQDTGSTAKAFEGEEIDWYVCNVASYHVKQSMDPSLALVGNEDLKRLMLLDDETIVRAAAVVVGLSELESLLTHYSAAEECVEAAKVAWVMGMVSTGSDRSKHAKSALDLLAQAASTTSQAQQLELDMRGTLTFSMRTGSPEKKVNIARMAELMTQNKSLWMDSLALFNMSIWPALLALFGAHPKM